MNRISGPAGLPHSCADMVRPSGVFTVIGLYFRPSPNPGCAMATSKAAATVVLTRRLSRAVIFIEILPLLFCGRASSLAPASRGGKFGWRLRVLPARLLAGGPG